jgi:hypothetical protein
MTTKPASEIELMILRRMWSDHPRLANICPHCLADRVFGFQHATWCSIKRDVEREEQNASDYEIQI